MKPAVPSESAPKILYVDDEPGNLKLFRLQFDEEFRIETAENGQAALGLLTDPDIGLVLTDERMPGMSGIDLLAKVSERRPEAVRIIVSAYSDSERLLAAINRGHAHEYIVKPWDLNELRACLQRSLAMATHRRALASRAEIAESLTEDLKQQYDTQHLIGAEGGLRRTVEIATKAAASDASVLILGETGTGKELIARLIHESSRRAAGPFVRVNCAALTESLLESELFGHEKGAFTGADRQRKGRFEIANRGTLFLDEIGDIPPKVQVALLRVLQERELERVGGNETLQVDVRVIAATHRDLEERVRTGSFRQDLLYRLNVIPVTVPPLKSRVEDLALLVGHFIVKHGGARRSVTPSALQALARYSWPGNVRELENLVQRALVLSSEPELDVDDFTLELAPQRGASVREEARDAEREQLRELLLHHGGNYAQAARSLSVPRTTLISRAKKLGLA